ncbi:hypothetical protein ACIOJE_27385 [Kitasatospora sp. NPDC087861]|uniref:hypothetical protein n=1 Tax=Kitasatospora sp. NPDC087861 TaxID=3364070 RepID=UPI00382D37B3
MLTNYHYDDGHELRQEYIRRELNCPEDCALSELTVDHALQFAAVTAAQPTVHAANQRLLALFAALPTPKDDPEFWRAFGSAAGNGYFLLGNLQNSVRLTYAHTTETALAGLLLSGFDEVPDDRREALAKLVGERLGVGAQAGHLWIAAVEQAALSAVVASQLPRNTEQVEDFRDGWRLN